MTENNSRQERNSIKIHFLPKNTKMIKFLKKSCKTIKKFLKPTWNNWQYEDCDHPIENVLIDHLHILNYRTIELEVDEDERRLRMEDINRLHEDMEVSCEFCNCSTLAIDNFFNESMKAVDEGFNEASDLHGFTKFMIFSGLA